MATLASTPRQTLRIAIPIPTAADLPYNQRSWQQYAEAIRQAGAVPVEVPLDLGRADLRALVFTCEGICLPGSPADIDARRYGAERDPASADPDPAREVTDFALLDMAAADGKPVLGICFGLQSLNVWRGGTLVQDVRPVPVNHSAGSSVAIAHTVLVPPGSLLGSLLDPAEAPTTDGFLRLPVNTSHHQAVGVPGDGLRIVARCPEDAVIEAVELDPADVVGPRPSWMLGVQWHPERSTGISVASRSLFRVLVLEAEKASAQIPAVAR